MASLGKKEAGSGDAVDKYLIEYSVDGTEAEESIGRPKEFERTLCQKKKRFELKA